MNQNIRDAFNKELAGKLGEKYSLRWDADKRGMVCGWCRLADAAHITAVAEIVAGHKGRVMTISPLITSNNGQPEHVEINYHFYFEGVNCTVRVTLPEGIREVNSITPILKSADWHEREMQELYNVKVPGHPNPKKLFLDDSIAWTDNTMIPLSEAMSEASTNTLWEKIMKSKSKGEIAGE